MTGTTMNPNIDLLLGVPLEVSVELGTTQMEVRDILRLGIGSVVSLRRTVGEPVDLLVNARLVARGEIVAVDEQLGVRVTEILAPSVAP